MSKSKIHEKDKVAMQNSSNKKLSKNEEKTELDELKEKLSKRKSVWEKIVKKTKKGRRQKK